jgi:RES domain
LRLIDLTGDNAVRMGIPSDVARSSRQGLARSWSVAIHEHPATVDGICYLSRLNSETNLALYDRAISALSCSAATPLKRASGFAVVLNDLNVSLA